MSTMTQLQEMYIGLLGRAADQAGLTYWANEIDQGNMTIDDVRANVVNEQPEYADGLGSMTRSQALNELYNNLFNRDADAEGLEYWVNGGGASVNFDQLVLALIDGAQPMDRLILDNRAEVANYYSEYASSFNNGEAAAVLANVDNTRASVEAAISQVDGGSYNSEIRLTDGEDILNGSRGDDLFTAKIVDNNNTLESGDEIYGGAGNDTLTADIGNSQNFAITPELNSVENVVIRAQASATDINNDNNINDAVQIDAERSVGVNHWESNNSRADLVIEDVRIRDDQLTKDITIAMVDTDAGNVDYSVYFDQLSLRKEGATEIAPRELTLQLVDLIGAGNADGPLKNLPLTGFTIRLTDGTEIILDGGDAVNNATTYADLVEALNTVLAEEELDGTFEFTLGENFTASGTAADDTVYRATEPQIQLSILDGSLDQDIGFASVPGTNTSTSGFRFDPNEVTAEFRYNEQIVGDTGEIDPLITSTVILDNVGRGSMGGDLVIGGMSTGTTSESKGVEQFDITVEQSSQLQRIASTNDTLEVVNIVNGTEKGDLTVTGEVEINPFPEYSGKPQGLSDDQGDQFIDGTQNDYRGFGFTNVREINASEFEGKLNLNLALDGNVVDKYMDLFDVAANPAEDNIEFQYTLGTNDDDFFLALGSGNLSNPELGTTTREDFDLLIEGGAGDDTIDTVIYEQPLFEGDEANGDDGDANWYINSSENANLMIDAGEGNDTVSTHGSGNWVVDLGVGDDTYYADNTGDKAAWSINAVETSPSFWNGLETAANFTLDVYKAYLTVEVIDEMGGVFTAEVEVPSTNYTTSLLQYNQAVKDAINNDDVLSKLVEVNDGPANTLVVNSLIDGYTGLNLSLRAPMADELTDNEVNAFAQAHDMTGATTASVIAAIQAELDTFTDVDGYTDNVVELEGGDSSDHVADNIITGDLGNDVLVLGTGEYSNDTIVYEGFNNGVDTIVNFDTTYSETEQVVGNPGAPESFTVTFGDLTPSGDATIEFADSGVISLNDPGVQSLIPGADVAFAFAEGYAGSAWTVAYVPGTNQVTFETAANGNIADITDAAFDIQNASGTVTLSDYVQGIDNYVAAQDATATVFTVNFADTIVSGGATNEITFDGVDVDLTNGDGPITTAASVAGATYPSWTAVDNLDGTVTFTSTTLGSGVAVPAAADFGSGSNGVLATVNGSVGTDAAAQEGTATTTIVPAGAGLDFIDFTDYDVDAVEIQSTGQNVVFGAAPAIGDEWVRLTESATNDGYYEVELFEMTEDGADLVGHIADLDFGVEQEFVEQNFFNSALNTTLIA